MSDDQISIEINGTALPARKGQMIIQVADEAGVYIPRFCYHKKLSIAANCRMCLVDVEKAPKPVPACATPVMDGMKVRTRSTLAREAQKGVMEFLLINHPLDCPVCDQGGECELQDLALGYGRDVSRFTEAKRVVFDENIGPLVSTDMTRCIQCTRCVRFGEEIAGLRELGATGRGEEMRIGTYVKKAMASELSGNVIDICPVGALNNKPYRFAARAWELVQHEAVSPHDCVGSNLYLHTLRGRVKRAVPRENDAVNESWLADRDRFSCHALYTPQRVGVPQIKEGGKWRPASWQEALGEVFVRLQKIVDGSGASDIGALISPSATVEEHYLLQKLMRGLGSNNIDHRLHQYDFSLDAQAPAFPYLGTGLQDLESVDSALLIASNVRKEQPLAAHRLRKASLKGGRLMFVNHRRFALNGHADEYLVAAPKAMVGELRAIVQAALTIAGKQEPSMLASIDGITGKVAVDDRHKRIAQNLASSGNAVVLLGSQACLSPYYSALQILASVIAELTGARFGELSTGANAAGAWLAGAIPHRGVAAVNISEPGLTARSMFELGRKGYLLFGVEPELEAWNSSIALSALRAAETVVLCSAFAGPAAREYADVILPIATFAETAGTFINVEGRWQSFDAATAGFDEARPGWKVLRVLGNHFDLPGFDYQSSDEIRVLVQQACADVVPNSTLGRDGVAASDFTASDSRLLRVSDIAGYAGDMLARRSAPLQQTADGVAANVLLVNRATAGKHQLTTATTVVVSQGGVEVEMHWQPDEGVPDNSAWLGVGSPAVAALGPAFGAIEVRPL